MAKGVYSTRFIASTPAAPNPQYLVPLGFIAVIRQISVQQTAGAFSYYCYTQDSASAPQLVVACGDSVGFFNSVLTECRIVVPATGIITVNVSSGIDGTCMYVGGYLLTDDGSGP